MAGLKICTRWRAISARRSRRISSSLLPLNIGPQTTSIQPRLPRIAFILLLPCFTDYRFTDYCRCCLDIRTWLVQVFSNWVLLLNLSLRPERVYCLAFLLHNYWLSTTVAAAT